MSMLTESGIIPAKNEQDGYNLSTVAPTEIDTEYDECHNWCTCSNSGKTKNNVIYAKNMDALFLLLGGDI